VLLTPTNETISDRLQPAPRGSNTQLASHRYKLGCLIGRGGMGEILAVRDTYLGREVAVKRMLHASPTAEQTRRFLREARLQASHEHPAIAPVYDVGFEMDGRPYFTMKRIYGTTLRDILAERMRSRRALLRAFAGVCRAMEAVHARRVVHRDLKPLNIMIDAHDHPYVLDWGVAVRLDADTDFGDVPTDQSDHGSVAGSPGYIAPEIVEDSADPDPSADCYALGRILEDILSTFPETVPPSLEELYKRALGEPDDRPSAGALAWCASRA
jgi:eukaryotic-like serine/threonine-protein kinase